MPKRRNPMDEAEDELGIGRGELAGTFPPSIQWAVNEQMGGRYSGSKKMETHRGPVEEPTPGPHHAGKQLPSAMPRPEEKVGPVTDVIADEAILDERIRAQRRHAADAAGLRVKTTKKK